jgi:hypothetical protein
MTRHTLRDFAHGLAFLVCGVPITALAGDRSDLGEVTQGTVLE